MQEQILIYFLNFLFFYSLYKGFFKGGISELVSLVFLVVAFMLSVEIFDNGFYRSILAIFLFFILYNIGLFIAYLFKSQSLFDQITGILIGIIHFFTFLLFITVILSFMNSTPPMYKNNFYIRIIWPGAEYLQKIIMVKKNIN